MYIILPHYRIHKTSPDPTKGADTVIVPDLMFALILLYPVDMFDRTEHADSSTILIVASIKKLYKNCCVCWICLSSLCVPPDIRHP